MLGLASAGPTVGRTCCNLIARVATFSLLFFAVLFLGALQLKLPPVSNLELRN